MKCKFCKTEKLSETSSNKGHSLSTGGVACDDCNFNIVLPARLNGVHY